MTVLFSVDDHVATITLHRPEVRNAFGAGMGRDLGDALRRCDADDEIRVVVLTGTPPAFCAGADLGAVTQPSRRCMTTGSVLLRCRFPSGGCASR